MKINFKTKIDFEKNKCQSGVQEFEFIGKIYLETDLSELSNDFPYTSKPQTTKDDAMKWCHFYTLIKLKKYKYLDSHLKFCKSKAK